MTTVALAVFCGIYVQRVSAQAIGWEPTSGPEGGEVSRVLPVPSESGIVYAVVNGSLYRSDDDGYSWNELPHPWRGPHPEIGPIVTTTDGVLLAAAIVLWSGEGNYQAGVARSTNNGKTWAPLAVGPPEGSDAVLFDLHWIGGERVVGRTGAGLFVSDDAGATWASFTIPVPLGTQLGSLATHPSGVIAARYSDGDSITGVVSSSNGGETWRTTLIATPPAPGEPWFNALTVAADGTLFGTNFNEPHVWRSTDFGATWTTTTLDTRGLFSVVTSVDVDDSSGALYAATRQGGAYMSTDGGVTWEPFGLGDLTVQTYARVDTRADGASGGGGDLLAGTADGVYRRAPGADDWAPSRSGLARMFVQDVAAGPGGVLYASESLGSVILRSPDGGATWERIDEVERTSAIAVAPSGTIYAGTGPGNDVARLWRSSDGSPNSFEPLPSFPGLSASVVHITPTGGVLAGNHGLYRSVNDGATWAAVLDNKRIVLDVVTDADSESGVLYAGTGDGVLRSTDDGATWEQIGLEEERVVAVWASGTSVLAGVLGLNFSSAGLHRSNDGGQTWELVLANGLVEDLVSVDTSDAPELFVSLWQTSPERRAFRSLDAGATWEPLVEGLPGPPFGQGPMKMTAQEGRVYATMLDRGVWRTAIHVVASEVVPVSDEAEILTVYPNPSSGTTIVALTLTETNKVCITVHDILGREIMLLHQGPLTKGIHRFVLGGRTLPTGVYIVRITGAGLNSSQEVTLVR